MKSAWLWLGVLACVGGDKDPEAEPPVCTLEDPPVDYLHRLSNPEYDRTIAELAGVTESVAASFPPDGSASGYDHVSRGQAIAPIHVEAWDAGAAMVADAVVQRDLWTMTFDLTAGAEELYEVAAIDGGGFLTVLEPGARYAFDVSFPGPGDYEVVVEALWTDGWQNPDDGSTPPRVVVQAGDGIPGEAEIRSRFDAYAPVAMPLDVQAGVTDLSVEFYVGRAVAVRRIWVRGRTGDAVFSCLPGHDEACTEAWLERWVTRAWRRPPTAEEVAQLRALVGLAVDHGDPVEVGLALAMRAVLLSPHFLFLVESNQGASPGEIVELSPWEKATRLSYTLWRSMPDEALFSCAADGGLARTDDPCGLDAQVERMLADPRSDVLVDDWVTQWLQLRGLASVVPDAERFPGFTPALAEAMAEETRRGVAALRSSQSSLMELLDGSTTWVDGELASHYGLPAVQGWTEVAVGEDRRGILRQGAMLTLTSQPTRTSPVSRGQWVLTHLLCDPVDEPPPNVGTLEDGLAEDDPRAALDAHLSDPTCAGCHARLDPVGLALEAYDPVGQLREEVDASAVLPDGTALDGAGDLVDWLRDDPRVRRCMVRQFMTWAAARSMEDADCAVERTESAAVAEGLSIDDLMRAYLALDWVDHRQIPAEVSDAP